MLTYDVCVRTPTASHFVHAAAVTRRWRMQYQISRDVNARTCRICSDRTCSCCTTWTVVLFQNNRCLWFTFRDHSCCTCRVYSNRTCSCYTKCIYNAATKVAKCKSQTTIPETHFGINTTAVNVVQQLYVWLLQTRHVLNVFTVP